MKFLKFAVAAVFAATFSNAYAFHSGGVAECEGCHSMHNSFDGSPNVTGRTFAQGTGIYLLKANDQSGACLNCHQAADTAPSSYHISTAGINPYDSTAPVEMTPGGDFAWLKKTMNVVIREHHRPRREPRRAPRSQRGCGRLRLRGRLDPHGRPGRDVPGREPGLLLLP